MEETFRELDLLIHDGTGQELPETEREQKRKAATLKARDLEKAFTGTILKIQGKKSPENTGTGSRKSHTYMARKTLPKQTSRQQTKPHQ